MKIKGHYMNLAIFAQLEGKGKLYELVQLGELEK